MQLLHMKDDPFNIIKIFWCLWYQRDHTFEAKYFEGCPTYVFAKYNYMHTLKKGNMGMGMGIGMIVKVNLLNFCRKKVILSTHNLF